MQYLYFVSGQAGSSVHETLCLLRDIYRTGQPFYLS